jgi:flagellar basal body P-ring protein FlgI
MPNIRFDASVSLGSIATIATVLVALVTNYVTIKTDIEQVKDRLVSAGERMSAADRRIEKVEDFENTQSRIEAERNSSLANRLTGLEVGSATMLTTLQELRQEIRARGTNP